MSGSTLQKAQLIPLDPTGQNAAQARMDQAITVHFNPDTLKLSYTVNLKADTGSKNSSDQAAQQSSSSSAKLAVDLVFDTTDLFEAQQDGADVRKQVTNKIVETFVAPPAPDGAAAGKPIPANPCLFLWGTFQFIGMVDSYNETLEFFSASGVPLRAAVSMSLAENRYKIDERPATRAGRSRSHFRRARQIGLALTAAGMDPDGLARYRAGERHGNAAVLGVGQHQCRHRCRLRGGRERGWWRGLFGRCVGRSGHRDRRGVLRRFGGEQPATVRASASAPVPARTLGECDANSDR